MSQVTWNQEKIAERVTQNDARKTDENLGNTFVTLYDLALGKNSVVEDIIFSLKPLWKSLYKWGWLPGIKKKNAKKSQTK